MPVEYPTVFANCPMSLHFDMVLMPTCKTFIRTAAAQMRRERSNAGGDDDESSEEDGAPDPAGFQAASAFKDCVKNMKTPPAGGGGKEHKAYLKSFRAKMLRFVKEALGDLPTGTLDLQASEMYFKRYLHQPSEPIVIGAGAAGAAGGGEAEVGNGAEPGDAEVGAGAGAGAGNAEDAGGNASDGSIFSVMDMSG